MNIKNVFLVTFCFACNFLKTESIIVIRPQTQQEAFEYVIGLIKELPWFKANKYYVALPQHAAFEKVYANPETLDENKDVLKKVFFEHIHNPDALLDDCRAIGLQKEGMEQLAEKLVILHSNWGFKLFTQYHVTLTWYGPGGSYNKNTGTIIYVRAGNKIPACQAILHEMVHIGIEENIVQKYKLSHWEKERLVDVICSTFLLIPDYWSSPQGCVALDPFITVDAIRDNLPAAIERFIAQYPR